MSAMNPALTRAWRNKHIADADAALEQAQRALNGGVGVANATVVANAWTEIAKAHYRAVAVSLGLKELS